MSQNTTKFVTCFYFKLTTCFGPVLGHLQVTKLFIRGNYSVSHKTYQSKTDMTIEQQDIVEFYIDIFYCIVSSNKYFCDLKMAQIGAKTC